MGRIILIWVLIGWYSCSGCMQSGTEIFYTPMAEIAHLFKKPSEKEKKDSSLCFLCLKQELEDNKKTHCDYCTSRISKHLFAHIIMKHSNVDFAQWENKIEENKIKCRECPHVFQRESNFKVHFTSCHMSSVLKRHTCGNNTNLVARSGSESATVESILFYLSSLCAYGDQ